MIRAHHLCVATMCPWGGALYNRHRRLVCHALLLELPDGLVLVDTGLGTADVADPSRLGAARWANGFVFDPAGTAKARIEALGFAASDVRHVIVTHLDLDHAGGLGDFPDATVHVHATELAAARAPTLRNRARYRAVQWAHGPRWSAVSATGEPWFGFEAVRDLPGLPPEVLLVPLFGHSPGQVGVAVDTGSGWLLHAGDAYFHEGEIGEGGTVGAWMLQRVVQHDDDARRRNVERLRALRRDHGDAVTVFCAHDPDEFERLATL